MRLPAAHPARISSRDVDARIEQMAGGNDSCNSAGTILRGGGLSGHGHS
jgi:hypothetical protein